MRIQQVQPNTNFQTRQNFLNEAQKENVKSLVENMSKSLEIKTKGIFFDFSATNRLKIADKAEFVGISLSKNKDRCFDKVQLNTKYSQLVINTETGEIEHYHKPFLKRWSKVMENVDKYLSMFQENFNNSNVVEKGSFKISGMTPEAFEVFQNEVDKLFKESKKK